MVSDSPSDRAAAVRDDFLRGRLTAPAHGGVSDLIAASWQRSHSAGVDFESAEATYHEDLDVSSRLVRCAHSILQRVLAETADIPLSLALTDRRARILQRVDTDRTLGLMLDRVQFAPGFNYAEGEIGTNGVGTAFESGQTVHIVGAEHFHERLQPFACAGSPIRDPMTGQVEGVLDISCLTEQSSPLMHALARSTSHAIERSLLLDRSGKQQALFEEFTRRAARSRHAIIAASPTTTMSNTLAQTLLSADEVRILQQHAAHLATSGRTADRVELPSGVICRVRADTLIPGDLTSGIVFEVALLDNSARPMDTECRPHEPSVSPPPNAGSRMRTSMDSLRPSGQSPAWKRACDDIAQALSERTSLLVLGETGTGKFSLVTEIYHQLRAGGRSVVIDAADLGQDAYGAVEQTIEQTATPTLYVIRNIDELSTDGSDRLDELLLNLADSVTAASFVATVSDATTDSDLPFRPLLTHFQQAVTVPALRHRTDDIPLLIPRILHRLAPGRTVQLTPAAMRAVLHYSWPKNIRQLEEALKSALSRRPVGDIGSEDLPGFCHDAARRQLSSLESVERDAIVRALHEVGGNRVLAAQTLGIARSSLYRKLRSYGIETL